METLNSRDAIEIAKAYLLQKNADKAYDLLAPLEPKLAGSVEFDYIFGLAALDSGHPAKATLVLERVLLMQPNFPGARLDLGRAYFAMGNYTMAQNQFKKVLESNPPPFAKNTTLRYLEAVKKQKARRKTFFACYGELKAGYDSNVNASTDEHEVYSPTLQLPITLSENNVRQDDGYTGYGAGFRLKHRLPGKLFWGFRGNADKRSYFNKVSFNTGNFNIANSFGYENSANIFQMNMSCGVFLLNNDVNKQWLSGGLEWRHMLNSKNLLTTFGQYTTIRFPELEIEDYNQAVAGLSWFHATDWLNSFNLITSIYGGMEEELEGRANGDKDFGGLMAGFETSPMQKLTLFAGAGGYIGNYDQENQAFLEKREDRQFDARAGLKWMPAKNVSVNPQINYIQNNSNIEIYEYSRTDFSVTFRYDL